MYSVFFSKIDISFNLIESRLKSFIRPQSKVVIIPWSFAIETDAKGLENFFSGKKRNKYIEPLLKLGINLNDICILNCYKDDSEYMKKMINNSDILVLPGGNPEMFYNKVKECNLLNDIKNYKNIIIGESAGTELQLKKYFITAKNNYYKKFDWYDGFDIINDNFYLDVHSSNNYRYLNKLQKVATETLKDVYAIFNDGVILYDRLNKKIELFGNVKLFNPVINNKEKEN